MSSKRAEIPTISTELSEADLGDERLNRRLGLLADQLAARPDDGALESGGGMYRFPWLLTLPAT